MRVKNVQQPNKKIGYLGPAGTNTEQALIQFIQEEPVEICPYETIQQVIQAVEKGEINEGVVPVENSLEGSVNVTLDLLAASTVLKVKAEVILPIEHWLLLPVNYGIAEITKVLSHPQALGQCRSKLEEILPTVELKECTSTAKAAEEVAVSGQPWAAIGPRNLAEVNNLLAFDNPLLMGKGNFTRFLVVALEDSQPTGRDKTSIVFDMQDRPGGLHTILKIFADRGINLTRIESRPAKTRLGKYIFFADLDGHRQDIHVLEALVDVARQTSTLKIMGSYPRMDQSIEAATDLLDLSALRLEIDLIDQEIVQLLAKRAVLVTQVGQNKNCSSTGIRDVKRERQILRRLKKLAGEQGLDPELVSKIYRMLFTYFVKQQTRQLEEHDHPLPDHLG